MKSIRDPATAPGLSPSPTSTESEWFLFLPLAVFICTVVFGALGLAIFYVGTGAGHAMLLWLADKPGIGAVVSFVVDRYNGLGLSPRLGAGVMGNINSFLLAGLVSTLMLMASTWLLSTVIRAARAGLGRR